MTKDAPALTPALQASHAPPHSEHGEHPNHLVTDWGVLLDAKRNSIVLHLSDTVRSPVVPIASHFLSIPAVKQVSEALAKAVDDYLKTLPNPETE